MIAYITGATSGFGKAIARKLAQLKYDLVITGRRKERLEELAATLQQEYQIKVLVSQYDVRDYEVVKQAIENLPEEW
jgi:NADP-dependent 3-hydroxy acid dehydrogenase YdfG